jgi:hypothetical protein
VLATLCCGDYLAQGGGNNTRLHRTAYVELHNLYSSPNVITMIKSRKMTWMVYVARIGNIRNLCKFFVGNLEEKDHFEDKDVEGMILKWTLNV